MDVALRPHLLYGHGHLSCFWLGFLAIPLGLLCGWVCSAGGTQAESSARLGTLPCVYMSLASQIPPLSGVPDLEETV